MTNKKGNQMILLPVGIVILVIALFVVVMGFDYVPAGHIGVKDKLGVVENTPWGPGVEWTGLMTGTTSFSTRIQLKEYAANAASKDLQIVSTNIALNFKINPIHAPEIYKTIGTNYQDIIIAPIIQEAVKSVTAKYTADDLVQQRTNVKTDITEYIVTKLENKGLIVTEVAITDFKFSAEYNAAIERKQVAEQDALTAKNRLEEMKFTSESMKLQNEVLEIKKLDIEVKKLEVQEKFIDKWDGQMPNVLFSGNGGGMNTLMNMDLPMSKNDQ